MALKVLVNRGFRVYKSVGDRLDRNIGLLATDELDPFNMEAAMANAAVCGGACDACVTDCEEEKEAGQLIANLAD